VHHGVNFVADFPLRVFNVKIHPLQFFIQTHGRQLFLRFPTHHLPILLS
jgi:hypothetical protein